MASRGIRNNNPGNIRAVDQWQGMTGQDDQGFAIFDSPASGLRAMSKTLDTYSSKHGLNTIDGIVNRWAPPGDNNDTPSYVKAVSAAMGVDAMATLNLADAGTKAKLMSAIVQHENGENPYTADQFNADAAFPVQQGGGEQVALSNAETPGHNPNDPYAWDGQAASLLQPDTPDIGSDPLAASRQTVAQISGNQTDVNLLGGQTGTDVLHGIDEADKVPFWQKPIMGFQVGNAGNDLWNFAARTVLFPRERAFQDNLSAKYDEFIKQVPLQYASAFNHIGSDAEMNSVIGEINRDLDSMRVLQYSGATGVVSSLLAGVVDVDIALSLLSGGEYAGAKGGFIAARLAKIGRGTRQGLAAGTAVGLVQSETSPIASPLDLPMNILGATAFGAAGGMFGKAHGVRTDVNIDKTISDLQAAKARGETFDNDSPDMTDGFLWPSVSEMADRIGQPVGSALKAGREALVKRYNQMRAGIDPDAVEAPAGSASAMKTPQGPKLEDIEGMSAETVDAISAARAWRAQTAWRRSVDAAGNNPRVARFLEMVNKVPGMKTDWEVMVASKSAIINKLSYDLMESATGILQNNKSAAYLKDMYFRRMVSLGNPMEDATQRWIMAKGGGFMDRFWNTERRMEFDKLMQHELMRRQQGEAVDPNTDPHIIEAVDAWEKFTDEGHNIAVGRGNQKSIYGFDAAAKRKGYFSVIWRGDKIRAHMLKMGGRDKMIAEWGEMIRNDHPNLTTAEAKATALAFLNRALSKDTEVDSSLVNMLASDGRERLRKELLTRVDAATADRILDILGGKVEERGMQARAKGRMTMDLRQQFSDGTSLLDLVENDMRYLMQSYAHNIGGAAALARKGIRSQSDVDDLINSALEEQKALGIEPGNATYVTREFLEHAFSYFGTGPVNKGLHPVVRLMKQVTNLALLNQLALSQLAETGASIAAVGLGRWVDTAKPIVREMFEHPDKQKSRRLFHELEPLTGKIGDSHNIYRDDILLDEVRRDPSAATTWMDGAEKIALKGRRIQGYTSLFNQVQSAQQKISMEIMISKVMKELRGETPNIRRLQDIGIQDRVFTRIKKMVDTHVEFDANGNPTMLNVDKWDMETAEDFAVAMNRSTYRHVQRAMAGEETMWMTKDIGSLFMHLKTFPMLAMKKQFIREARIMDAETKALFMYGLGTASAAFVAKQALNGNFDRLDPGDIAIGAFGMSNMTGWIPMWTDPVASMFGMDEARFNQYGARGVSEGILPVPAAITTLNKMAHIPGAAIHMLPFGGDLTNGDISALKTVPLVGNAYGWSAFMNALRD